MKKIIAIVILLLTGITFSTHFAYTEEKGITIFPKESFNFAYTFVDVDELRKEAQEMGMLATLTNKSMVYILTRYRQYENKEYKSNIANEVSNELKASVGTFLKIAYGYYLETKTYSNNFELIGFTPPKSNYYTVSYSTEANYDLLIVNVKEDIGECKSNSILNYTINVESPEARGTWKSENINCKELIDSLNN